MTHVHRIFQVSSECVTATNTISYSVQESPLLVLKLDQKPTLYTLIELYFVWILEYQVADV